MSEGKFITVEGTEGVGKSTNMAFIENWLKQAGKELIQVIDNGIGMEEEDAILAFERHATSKIASTADLSSISTLGFRGYANDSSMITLLM